MTQNVNQFAQAPVLGQMDLQFQGSVVTAMVSKNQATALVAGQPVKVEDALGGIPAVLALAAASDAVSGFLARNLKDQNFPTLSRAEMAMDGSVMYMVASAAIARFGAVEIDFATAGNVKPSGGINPVVGLAFDKAVNVGDLIRVLIRVPSTATGANGRVANVTATLAQINAGLVVIPGALGKKITITSVVQRVIGAFASGTSVNLQSDATSVIVEATAEAGLTNGAVLTTAPTANVTLGAGFATPLPAGEGAKIVNIGAAQTVGTSIQFTISYTQG